MRNVLVFLIMILGGVLMLGHILCDDGAPQPKEEKPVENEIITNSDTTLHDSIR